MRFGLDKVKKFPVMEFLELAMPQIDEEFMLVPVEDDELKGRAAETIPTEHVIRVKQSVYDAACQGSYWAERSWRMNLGIICFMEKKRWLMLMRPLERESQMR